MREQCAERALMIAESIGTAVGGPLRSRGVRLVAPEWRFLTSNGSWIGTAQSPL